MKYFVTSLFLLASIMCVAQNPVDLLKQHCTYISKDPKYVQLVQEGQKESCASKTAYKTYKFSQATQKEFAKFIHTVELEALSGTGMDVSEFSAIVWKYVSKQLQGQSGPLTTNPNDFNLFLISKETSTDTLTGYIAVLWDGTHWVIVPIIIERLKFTYGTPEFRIFHIQKGK